MSKKSKHLTPNHLLTKQEVKDTIKRLGFKTQRAFAESIGMSEANWSGLYAHSKTSILTKHLLDSVGVKNIVELIDEIEVLREKLEDIAILTTMREG